MAKTQKPKGLRLTLGGAPNTAHTVPGLRGFFYPDLPTPVGGDGDLITLEQAKAAASDPGTYVDLVDIPMSKVEEYRDRVFADLAAATVGVRDATRHALTESEAAHVQDQRDVLRDISRAPQQPDSQQTPAPGSADTTKGE